MKLLRRTPLGLLLAFLLAPSGARLAAADPQVAKIVQAADALVQTLSDSERKTVQFEFDDAQQRLRWSNLPVDMVKRAGLRMGSLTEAQRAAAWALLRVTLSAQGFEKVMGIVQGDEVLRKQGGTRMSFGEAEFYLAFLGKPSVTSPWLLQFGGHHLALNVTIAGDRGVLTPSLIAVQPARFEWNGKVVRPMGRETEKALELMRALDPAQQKSATLGAEMRDLVLGPGHDGETLQPEGVKVSTFNPSQQKLLLDLVAEWSGIIYDAAADQKLKEIKARIDETWFAWSGPMEAGKAYFRIQGPTVVIEYAPQRLGGDVTMHLHSMYRDPTNDYGRPPTRK